MLTLPTNRFCNSEDGFRGFYATFFALPVHVNSNFIDGTFILNAAKRSSGQIAIATNSGRWLVYSRLAVAGIKAGQIENVFETLMGDVEETLAEKFPSDREFDANELENHLLVAHRF